MQTPLNLGCGSISNVPKDLPRFGPTCFRSSPQSRENRPHRRPFFLHFCSTLKCVIYIGLEIPDVEECPRDFCYARFGRIHYMSHVTGTNKRGHRAQWVATSNFRGFVRPFLPASSSSPLFQSSCQTDLPDDPR